MREAKTSVFKRPNRDKRTGRNDDAGKPITVKVRGGWCYRIRFVDRDGLASTVERGGFHAKNVAKDAMNVKIRELEQREAEKIKQGERMAFGTLADICETDLYKPAVLDKAGKVSAGVKSHVSAKAFTIGSDSPRVTRPSDQAISTSGMSRSDGCL